MDEGYIHPHPTSSGRVREGQSAGHRGMGGVLSQPPSGPVAPQVHSFGQRKDNDPNSRFQTVKQQ